MLKSGGQKDDVNRDNHTKTKNKTAVFSVLFHLAYLDTQPGILGAVTHRTSNLSTYRWPP